MYAVQSQPPSHTKLQARGLLCLATLIATFCNLLSTSNDCTWSVLYGISNSCFSTFSLFYFGEEKVYFVVLNTVDHSCKEEKRQADILVGTTRVKKLDERKKKEANKRNIKKSRECRDNRFYKYAK